MSKSPWKNIGDWAAEAEREEAEQREAEERAAAAQPATSFPSLKEAASTAGKQKKKTKMTLQEFSMQTSGHSAAADYSRGLTHEEMLRLPTGPKERSADEMQYGRLGGGFSNYGTRPGSGGPNQGRPREYDGRRSYGFQDEDRRGGPPQSRVSELNQPSRADGVDNWASMKRQTMPEYNSAQGRPGPRYASLGGGGGAAGVASRADEVDNWASAKKPITQPQQPRSSSFGSGFSRPEPDRWTRGEQRLVLDPPKSEGDGVVKVNKPNPFGAARPREDVLAEKGLDWKKLDLEIEEKKQSVSGGSRPQSSHSSRPASSHSQSGKSEAVAAPGAGEDEVKQKPKVNPFGNAKPREVLLEEKGLDWKKIDLELEHRRVERPETDEEKKLKEEIEELKKQLQETSGNDQTAVGDLILQKEQELETLVRELNDKVRYSQKHERPGSGAGRVGSFNERVPSRSPSMTGSYDDPRSGYPERPRSRPGRYEDPRGVSSERPPSRGGGGYGDPRAGYGDRPPSRPGSYEDPRGGFNQGSYPDSSRGGDYNERPRSRGGANSWARAGDERRNVQSGGGRGFLGGRDVDRSGSRW
ncbi:eukaryotic translation initiation factor 4B1-like [Andrographis paniculata]|uniref:eukaryotic translation initiation factor 4B1-like n=1 Tax=Andrographis paniculata TaxID=175694 RepID=UPI0021E74FF5|nr:eukaryotic translation initiation factor 4B1-like [Andrographis paniculata]